MKRSECHDQPDCGAVWICGDESAIALARRLLVDQSQVIGVHLRNHQWYICLHSKCAGVSDDGVPRLGKLGLEFFRDAGVERGKDNLRRSLRGGVAHNHLRDLFRNGSVQLPPSGLPIGQAGRTL